MKKFLIFLILFSGTLWGSASIGSATAQFLEVNLNARNMAMGNASTSLIQGSSAMLVNPAGLADLSANGRRNYDTYFSLLQWPAEITFGSANIGFNLGMLGVLGVNTVFVNYGDEIRTTPDAPMGDGTFSMTSYAAGLTYARYLTDKFSFGMNMKLISEDFDGSDYQQLAFDLGTMYHTGFRNLNIGMSILHFSKETQFSGLFLNYSDKEQLALGDSSNYELWPLPMTFRTGMSMDILKMSAYTVTAAFDMIHTNNSREHYGLGFEMTYLNNFILRGGYQFGTDIEGLSAGMGLRISQNIKFDYAYNTMDYLGGRHRIGLNLGF